METGCRAKQGRFATILLVQSCRSVRMMDPMLTKPKNHKARNPWPLILLIGIAALCFVVASQGLRTVTELLVKPL